MRTLTHIVTAQDDAKPISRVVRSRLGLSYHLFAQLKLRDAILLDGVSVHANHPVREGQQVSVLIDEPVRTCTVVPEPGPIDIAYRDADILILNKPAPLPCQSSERQSGGTLENRLAYHIPGHVLRPVNRLDKGTSGLMAVAMHPHAQMLLSKQLHTDAFVREYLAMVCGTPRPLCGIVNAPIGKADGATVRREVRPDGKEAATHYEVLQSGALSLVKLRLGSGRTHQIRVHMAHLGCPVFGDFLYGEEDARLPGRFALHSHRIALDQPVTGERLTFEAPLPIELARLL